jgi:predicted TIM-barrel fold metal-dependent hydrolase
MEDERVVVVDSHVHFWDRSLFDYAWLAGEPVLGRDFLPADLVSEPDRPALAGVVAVQADCLDTQSAAEAGWFEHLADEGAPVLGIVAHAPLERGAGVAEELRRRGASPLVVGVRRLLQGEPDGYSLASDFVDGVRLLASHGLVMDLCVRHHQLREMAQLVERCPHVVFVLDHLGKPTLDRAAFSAWADDLADLAALPNVSCKLSGLSTEDGGRGLAPPGFQPWLEHALEVFGPRRCLFGSDWPVVTAGMGYASWYQTVLESLDGLTAEDRSSVLSGNAHALYDPLSRGARAKEQ